MASYAYIAMKALLLLFTVLAAAFTAGFFGAEIALNRLSAAVIPSGEDAERFGQLVVELTNAQRASRGLPPLKMQNNLRDAALWLARDMAENTYVSHTDSRGRDLSSRVPAFGYGNFADVVENLAVGVATPRDVVEGWMSNERDRANILDANLREIGVGYAVGGKKPLQRYWVGAFGHRPAVYPIVINNEAAHTADANVELYIYGCPQQGTGSPQGQRGPRECSWQMRVSNNGATWTSWENYTATRKWTLAPGTGTRQVVVELRSESKIYRAKDIIELGPREGAAAHTPIFRSFFGRRGSPS